MLEIVEGEAIGWSRCARARSWLNGLCHAPGACQLGFGVREKPAFVGGLCRAPDSCWLKAVNGPVLKHGPRSLTCTRVGGWKTRKRKETDWWEGLCLHHRPTMIFCERFEYERTCWDPKDGELCLSRAKPEETLVEARRCADVQIAFRTWV